jgi:hypothetical protein
MMNKSFCVVLVLSLLVISGCGSGKVGLSGKVVFSDDKSPLTIGTVYFETDTYLARAELKPDGTFVTGSVKQDDGLPPGKYRVYIPDAQRVVNSNTEMSRTGTMAGPKFEPLIDPKYARADTSGLEVEITSTTKNFVIEVDRPPGKK